MQTTDGNKENNKVIQNFKNPELGKHVIFLIRQFLYERGFVETANELERESRLFFNRSLLLEMILKGDWESLWLMLETFFPLQEQQKEQTYFLPLVSLWYLVAQQRIAELILK